MTGTGVKKCVKIFIQLETVVDTRYKYKCKFYKSQNTKSFLLNNPKLHGILRSENIIVVREAARVKHHVFQPRIIPFKHKIFRVKLIWKIPIK